MEKLLRELSAAAMLSNWFESLRGPQLEARLPAVSRRVRRRHLTCLSAHELGKGEIGRARLAGNDVVECCLQLGIPLGSSRRTVDDVRPQRADVNVVSRAGSLMMRWRMG